MKRIARNLNVSLSSKTTYLITGLLVGAVVFGGTSALASNRTAQLTASYRDIRIVVDGTELTPKDAAGGLVEPFIVDGTTYLPVRAVGEAVGYKVTWDNATSTVYLGDVPIVATPEPTEAPAAGSVKDRLTVTSDGKGGYDIKVTGDAISGKLANGTDVTEENILAILAELEAIYPQDTSWGDGKNGTEYTYRSPFAAILTFGSGCNSWAYMTADLVWGKGAEFTKHNDLSKVKIGDVVYLYNKETNNAHWLVVMGTGVDSENLPLFKTCEGNGGGRVFWWSNRYVKSTTMNHPDSTVYSFY